jgi:hypothetical protein
MAELILVAVLIVAPLVLIAAIGLGGLWLARRFTGMQLPRIYVGLHLAVMGIIVLWYFLDAGIPDIPFDDFYFPFLFYPGYISSLPGWAAAGLLWPKILDYISGTMGSRVCIFYIPSVVNLLLGSAAWYTAGVIVKRRITRAAIHQLKTTGDPLRGSPAPQP